MSIISPREGEVLASRPYDDRKTLKEKWTAVAAGLYSDEFPVDARRARERTDLLVAKFKRDTADALEQSGGIEDFTEKDALLQEVLELREEEDDLAKQQAVVREEKETIGTGIRKRAMEGLAADKRPVKKANNQDVLTFLKEKTEKEMNVREQELRLKQREIDLAQQRLEMERAERQAAIESQKAQTNLVLKMLEKIQIKC